MSTPLAPTLATAIVEREPIMSHGYSGNVVERVRLADGRTLIHKSVSPAWDWLSRATNDQGRIVEMWGSGLFDRFPAAIDHATVAVEPEGDAWHVYMRDVASVLVPPAERIDRASVRRVLAAMADLHSAFMDARHVELCSIEDRYLLLSPSTARRERELGNATGDTLDRGWNAFADAVPNDIASAVFTILDNPSLLADQLRTFEQTLVHGDVRLSNLGLTPDTVVLIDWGERTGTAPAAVELASFLAFDAGRLEPSKDEVIAEFGTLSGDRRDDRALQLALLGAVVQLGAHFGLEIANAPGEDHRAAAVLELSWWTTTAETALAIWSPTGTMATDVHQPDGSVVLVHTSGLEAVDAVPPDALIWRARIIVGVGER